MCMCVTNNLLNFTYFYFYHPFIFTIYPLLDYEFHKDWTPGFFSSCTQYSSFVNGPEISNALTLLKLGFMLCLFTSLLGILGKEASVL